MKAGMLPQLGPAPRIAEPSRQAGCRMQGKSLPKSSTKTRSSPNRAFARGPSRAAAARCIGVRAEGPAGAATDQA